MRENRRRRRKHGGGSSTTPTVYAQDLFNRADAPLTAADIGGTWTLNGLAWQTASNVARIVAAAEGLETAYLDDAQADGAWSLDITVLANIGLMIRWIDDANFVYIRPTAGVMKTFRVTASVLNTVGSGGNINTGDTVKAVAAGSAIDVYVNGALGHSCTETQGQTSTKSGMCAQQTTGRVDNYRHAAS